MRESLDRAKMGPGIRTAGRILGLSVLLFVITFLGIMGAVMTEWIPVDLLSFEFVKILVLMVLIDLSAAAFCNGLFRLSGSFPGGVLPKVFLPEGIQVFSPWMPSGVWMEAFKGIVTENVEGKVIGKLLILFAVGFTVSWLKEAQEK